MSEITLKDSLMKFKIGDLVVGRDANSFQIGTVIKINYNSPDGLFDGYYINAEDINGITTFYYPEEVRKATKLELALK